MAREKDYTYLARVKNPCQTCTAEAIAVSASTQAANRLSITIASTDAGRNGSQLNINGHAVSTGDRILVKDGICVNGGAAQLKYNGIYTAKYPHSVMGVCTLTRASDLDRTDECFGACVLIKGGNSEGQFYTVSTDSTGFVLGGTILTWVQVSAGAGGGVTVAGTGLSLSAGGTTVDLDIEGMDALSTLSDGDMLAVYDLANTAHAQCTASQLNAYVSAKLATQVVTLSNKTLSAPSVTGLLTTSGDIVMPPAGQIGCEGDADLLTLGPNLLAVAGNLQIPDNGYIGCTSGTTLLQLLSEEVVVLGTITAASDEGLKNDIARCGGLDLIRRLEGAQWTWKSNGAKSLGVIAQQLQGVVPELVSGGVCGLSVNYNGLSGITINAVNELDSHVSSLARRLGAMEHQVAALADAVRNLTSATGAR